MVLNALVRGLAHVRSADPKGGTGGHTRGGLRELLAETTLERLLQAVALDPSLIREMRLLLEPLHGEPMMKLCDELEEASRLVNAETEP